MKEAINVWPGLAPRPGKVALKDIIAIIMKTEWMGYRFWNTSSLHITLKHYVIGSPCS